MHYYNEFDPQAAAWLQVLIDQHLIPEGVVDTRSIVEVTAADLGGFVQCHFFAGIGGWPLALQLAGVPASTRLWTGSCPCQPFSVAGEGRGTADERHLWPVFFDLIRACNPPLVFGEQVASAAVLGSSAKPTKRSAGKAVQQVWLDGVFADLESASYACGSSDIPAAGVGAPHIRQRCWWGAVRLADADNGRSQIGRAADAVAHSGCDRQSKSNADIGAASAEFCPTHGMADSLQPGLEGHSGNVHDGNEPGRIGANQVGSVAQGGEYGGLADAQGAGSSPGSVRSALAEPRKEGEGSCGVGNASEQRCEEQRLLLRTEETGRDSGGILEVAGGGEVSRVGHSNGQPTWRHAGGAHAAEAEHGPGESDDHGSLNAGDGLSGRMADTKRDDRRADEPQRRPEGGDAHRGIGQWNDAYWHPCRDGKYRRVPTQSVFQHVVNELSGRVDLGGDFSPEEISLIAEAAQGFPLASPEAFKVLPRGTVRPGLLKGAGNAIVPQVAAEFVKAFHQVIAP